MTPIPPVKGCAADRYASSPTTHVLVIDDDDAVRDAVEFMLVSFGFSASTAENGKEAMHHCQQRRPDLVITDILMPEMEGIETILSLQKTYAGLPILAMSGGVGGAHKEYLRMAGKLGAAATLAKPFGADELLAAVERCRIAYSLS